MSSFVVFCVNDWLGSLSIIIESTFESDDGTLDWSVWRVHSDLLVVLLELKLDFVDETKFFLWAVVVPGTLDEQSSKTVEFNWEVFSGSFLLRGLFSFDTSVEIPIWSSVLFSSRNVSIYDEINTFLCILKNPFQNSAN